MNAIARLILVSSAAAGLAVVGLDAEQQSAQQLLERGAYAETTQRVQTERDAGNNDPTSAYIAGQAFLRMDQNQQAREEFARLANGDDEAWKAIGQSAIALIDNAQDEAVAEGTRARDINGEHGFAHYQLGMALERRGDWNGAAEAFDRATQLMPNFAYAFYHAGVAHQRAKRFNQMAERFTTFLQLAPEAPERRIVQLALNALRG
ncbi:MAG: tetratricopeptide repeat protein [Vicinamibacterales bacterium]